MKGGARETLRELVARHGPGLASDARRCEGLLRDLCGAHRREINLLVNALEERVPLDLLAAQRTMPHGLLLARLSKRLEEQLGLTEEAARWAVESWALALGVVTDAELAEQERRRAEEAVRMEAAAPPLPSPPRERPPSAPPPEAPRAAQPKKAPQQAPMPQAPAPRRTGGPPAPPFDPSHDPLPARRGRSLRGCAVGCLVVVLLSLALFFGVPYVVSVLREEQQRRNAETPPALAQ